MSVKGTGSPFGGQNRQTLFESFPHSFNSAIPMMEKVSNVSVKVANPCVVYVRDNLEKLCRPFLRFWYKEMSVCSPDFATNQPASPAHNTVSRGISRQGKKI